MNYFIAITAFLFCLSSYSQEQRVNVHLSFDKPAGGVPVSESTLTRRSDWGTKVDYSRETELGVTYGGGLGFFNTSYGRSESSENNLYELKVTFPYLSLGYIYKFNERGFMEGSLLAGLGQARFSSAAASELKLGNRFIYGVQLILGFKIYEPKVGKLSFFGGLEHLQVDIDDFEYQNKSFNGKKISGHTNFLIGLRYSF